MKFSLVNLILFLASVYILYTLYDTQIKNKREPMEIINPQSFDDQSDYLLQQNNDYEVIPFDSGTRVNNFLTCVNN
jgi:hypothetical protein